MAIDETQRGEVSRRFVAGSFPAACSGSVFVTRGRFRALAGPARTWPVSGTALAHRGSIRRPDRR
jgi:hypothetical protein